MEPRDNIHVLVVDDENTFRTVLAEELQALGYKAAQASRGAEALARLDKERVDVVLLDIRMPGMDGMEFLARVRKRESPPEVIMLTGQATVERAVEAMKRGALDFLTKPCPLDHVDAAIQKAWERLALRRENRMFRSRWPRRAGALVWRSEAMAAVAVQMEKVAPTDSTVLLEGESGVGKEVVAQEIHRLSSRAAQPFVVVDCTALREELLESELFGHERGAFTGAVAMKHGLFEVADGGTLFLDEITDLSPNIQAKLLRVIETRSFRRLGGTQTRVVNVRVLAAAQRELRLAVEEKRFREDLFYRLNVFRIRVPPLRERSEDIPLLAEHFLAAQSRRGRSSPSSFEANALDLLQKYTWPGNVRELKNVIERAVILTEGDAITAREVAPFTPLSSPLTFPASSAPTLHEFKRRYFEHVLHQTKGNKKEAARLAGVSERTLHRFFKAPSGGA